MINYFIEGLDKLGLELDSDEINKCMSYLTLLQKWNKVYNLSAITDVRQMIDRHLLDGISMVSHLPTTGKFLDVGSGMGIPGILVAITKPQLNSYLVDSNAKKTSFLRQVLIELGIYHSHVLTSRVEEIFEHDFDVIASRAFSSLELLLKLTKHLLHENGYYLVYKSKNLFNELIAITAYETQVIKLNSANLINERYLVKMTKVEI